MGSLFPETTSPPTRTLLSLALLVPLYLLLTFLHTTLLHPLRHIPGPPLARFTRAWSRLHNLRGRKSHVIHAAHQRYGAVIRVGPDELSFASPSAVRAIYASDAFVKEENFYRAKTIFVENHVMSMRDPDAHRARKRLLQRGFSQAAMLDFEPHMASKIRAMLDQWATRGAREPGRAIDVYPWALWLAFDTVYHLMFDEDPGSVEKGEPHWVMHYMRSWRPTFIYKEFVPQLERWGTLVPGYVGGYFRDVKTWKDFAVKVIERCRARGTRTPFLQNALRGDDVFLDRPLTDSELTEESMGGMFGGSGTTANTFVFLLWGALSKPEIARRLNEELRTAFPDRRAVPAAVECVKLPYLQAVINETLRVYPTIIATLPRTALRDTTVDGIYIPKGTIVGTQNYTIQRDAKAFPSPNEFIPERWLEKEGEELRKEAFVPFSVGQRSCLGINLAKMELSKLVAAFFLRFDAEVDEAMTEDDMRMYDVFSASPAGGKLLVRLNEVRG
ncbi:benzoate 4-monooxygenase [Neofusicoccum parvum]|uniref:Benzoate 4-monooxygenase n=1 Tax=Neofusicoccum parvum TaxID=310453 RepID=A0ACB5S301_9PEZI|nr:benzoate 4-monooxygenase [Neofusicoccum parvum]